MFNLYSTNTILSRGSIDSNGVCFEIYNITDYLHSFFIILMQIMTYGKVGSKICGVFKYLKNILENLQNIAFVFYGNFLNLHVTRIF